MQDISYNKMINQTSTINKQKNLQKTVLEEQAIVNYLSKIYLQTLTEEQISNASKNLQVSQSLLALYQACVREIQKLKKMKKLYRAEQKKNVQLSSVLQANRKIISCRAQQIRTAKNNENEIVELFKQLPKDVYYSELQGIFQQGLRHQKFYKGVLTLIDNKKFTEKERLGSYVSCFQNLQKKLESEKAFSKFFKEYPQNEFKIQKIQSKDIKALIQTTLSHFQDKINEKQISLDFLADLILDKKHLMKTIQPISTGTKIEKAKYFLTQFFEKTQQILAKGILPQEADSIKYLLTIIIARNHSFLEQSLNKVILSSQNKKLFQSIILSQKEIQNQIIKLMQQLSRTLGVQNEQIKKDFGIKFILQNYILKISKMKKNESSLVSKSHSMNNSSNANSDTKNPQIYKQFSQFNEFISLTSDILKQKSSPVLFQQKMQQFITKFRDYDKIKHLKQILETLKKKKFSEYSEIVENCKNCDIYCNTLKQFIHTIEVELVIFPQIAPKIYLNPSLITFELKKCIKLLKQNMRTKKQNKLIEQNLTLKLLNQNLTVKDYTQAKEINSLKEQIANLKKRLVQSRNTMSLELQKAKNHQLKDSFHQKNVLNDISKEQFNALTMTCSKLSNQLQKIENQKKLLEKNLIDKKKQIIELQQKNHLIKDQNQEALKALKSFLNSFSEQTKRKTQSYKKQLYQKQTEIHTLKQQLEILIKKNEKKQQEINNLLKQMKTQKQKFSSLLKIHEKNETQIIQYNKRIDFQKNKLIELQKSKDVFINNLSKQKQNLKSQKYILQVKVNTKQQEISKLQQDNTKIKEQLKINSQELMKKNSQFEQLQLFLKQQQNRTKIMLDSNKKTIIELETQKESLQRDLIQARQKKNTFFKGIFFHDSNYFDRTPQHWTHDVEKLSNKITNSIEDNKGKQVKEAILLLRWKKGLPFIGSLIVQRFNILVLAFTKTKKIIAAFTSWKLSTTLKPHNIHKAFIMSINQNGQNQQIFYLTAQKASTAPCREGISFGNNQLIIDPKNQKIHATNFGNKGSFFETQDAKIKGYQFIGGNDQMKEVECESFQVYQIGFEEEEINKKVQSPLNNLLMESSLHKTISQGSGSNSQDLKKIQELKSFIQKSNQQKQLLARKLQNIQQENQQLTNRFKELVTKGLNSETIHRYQKLFEGKWWMNPEEQYGKHFLAQNLQKFMGKRILKTILIYQKDYQKNFISLITNQQNLITIVKTPETIIAFYYDGLYHSGQVQMTGQSFMFSLIDRKLFKKIQKDCRVLIYSDFYYQTVGSQFRINNAGILKCNFHSKLLFKFDGQTTETFLRSKQSQRSSYFQIFKVVFDK